MAKARQIPQRIRVALCCRSGGLCERCGEERATQAHHRRPRGMGGSRDAATNSLANLLHLCSFCHEFIEWRRALAIQHGWLVKQCHDPVDVPVMYRGTFVWLDTVTPCAAGELIEASLTLGFGFGDVA